MTNQLKTYFPLIRDRKEILDIIYAREELAANFESWSAGQQEEFLDFCSGVHGVKLLYDTFFKEIMNPETTPERLEDFLSLLLQKKVRILEVLPNDSTRIADESSLLITDIVVELETHEIANVELQKIGYMFPGERSACYCADMLLRQYKRVRSRDKKKFSYRNVQNVYNIVLFENSPKEFHCFPETYLHHFSQQSDSGLELKLLQKYIFIPLDIFREILHNRDIKNRLEAWLVFLSMEDPEMIHRLITAFPDFMPIYRQIYDLCQNVEEVMRMFSEELRELDRNTVQLMIDELQEQVDRQAAEIGRKDQELAKKDQELEAERQRHKAEMEQRQQYEKELQRVKEYLVSLEKAGKISE